MILSKVGVVGLVVPSGSVQAALFRWAAAAIAVAVLAAGCGRGGGEEQGDGLGLGDLVDRYLEVTWGRMNDAHRFDSEAFPPPPGIRSLLSGDLVVESDERDSFEALEAAVDRFHFETSVLVHFVFASASASESPSESRLRDAYRHEKVECLASSGVPDPAGKSAYEHHIAKREAGLTDEDIAPIVDACHKQAMQFPALGKDFDELWEEQRQFYLDMAHEWVAANPERVVELPDGG